MSLPARVLSVVIALLLGLLVAGLGPSKTAAAAPAPVITKVGSGAGPLRPTTVVIRGKNLQGATAVRFGKKSGQIVRRVGPGEVEVRTPRGMRPGTVSVRIRTGSSWSRTSPKARYTFVAAPKITKLRPASGSFTGGQRVTLTGKNLKKARQVLFGSLKATIVSRTASSVVVRTPVGIIGRTTVKVITPGGTSRGATFTYTRPTPKTVSTVSPRPDTVVPPTVEWVTGGYDADTGEAKPWVVGLPQGSNVPGVGKPFLVPPGTTAFPSGLAGTVSDVAVQPDDSVRVTVTPSDLATSLNRLQLDYSGQVVEGTTRRGQDTVEAGRAASFSITGPTALFCKDPEGQSVTFGADLTMTVSDVDISQRVDLGNLVRKPKYDGAFTAELKTTGKITVAAQATCKLKPEWQNAQRRVIPLGTTGATVSFGPTLEFKVSSRGTWSVVDRTRTTFAVQATLGKQPQFSRTSRTVESKQGGALSFQAEVTAGASVQFGLLDRAGLEGKVLLGVSVGLEATGDNVCVDGKLFMKLSVGVFLDVWVTRWEAEAFSATLELGLVHECLLAERSAPPGEPEIVSARLPDAQIGAPYGATLTTGDGRNGTWSVVGSPLPAGLNLNPASGQISGTPTGPVGDHAVLIDFTDEDNQVATTTIRIMVKPSQGIAGGDIQVTLRWTGPADLDLHVLDPAGEEIYYSHRASASGGKLDRDANAACNGPADDDSAAENVFWPPQSAPPGGYTAWVKVYAICGGPLDWRLTVRRNGSIIIDETGTGDSPAYTFGVGQGSRVQVGPQPHTAARYPSK